MLIGRSMRSLARWMADGAPSAVWTHPPIQSALMLPVSARFGINRCPILECSCENHCYAAE
jgi:hypothetical protein